MKIISKCKITSPQFLIGYDFVTGRDNICQLNFLPHYQILLSGKYWTMRWIKTASAASSKNPSFADLDRLKLAGEVFAYLAVPAYSVEKSKAGADSQAWLLRLQTASDAGGPGGQTGRASWASVPPPGRRRPWPPHQTCFLAGSWAGSEAGERPAEGFPGGPQTASRGSDGRMPAHGLESPDSRCLAGLQLNCKKSGSGYLIAPVTSQGIWCSIWPGGWIRGRCPQLTIGGAQFLQIVEMGLNKRLIWNSITVVSIYQIFEWPGAIEELLKTLVLVYLESP